MSDSIDNQLVSQLAKAASSDLEPNVFLLYEASVPISAILGTGTHWETYHEKENIPTQILRTDFSTRPGGGEHGPTNSLLRSPPGT